MKTIWKYELKTVDTQEIELPTMAEILTVQMQGDNLCLWALVDNEAPVKPCVIKIFGTGHQVEFPEGYTEGYLGDYIGTYQLNDGALVFHVFSIF